MENNKEEVWLFNFTLESENGEKTERLKANELMDVVIAWAENNNCQIGGTYRAPKEGEFDDEPFKLK